MAKRCRHPLSRLASYSLLLHVSSAWLGEAVPEVHMQFLAGLEGTWLLDTRGKPVVHALLQGLDRHINCIAVHPSRPHLAATGAQAGAVAVWDLRFSARPTCHACPEPGAGSVWEVFAFSPSPWQSPVLLHACPGVPCKITCREWALLPACRAAAAVLAERVHGWSDRRASAPAAAFWAACRRARGPKAGRPAPACCTGRSAAASRPSMWSARSGRTSSAPPSRSAWCTCPAPPSEGLCCCVWPIIV